MKNIYSIKNTNLPLSFKDADTKKGIVTGYFASFNNIDSDGDVIVPGAFAKSIKETGPQSMQPRIKHLMNHDSGKPLGVILSLSEDEKGLCYESQIGTHSLGQDFIKMVDSGLITEHSIGYRTIQSDLGKGDDSANYLKEVQLWEGSSLTAWGANSLTPITGMKSEFKIDDIIERQKQIEKFCRSTSATDETIELLLIHSKQLSQIILDVQIATKAADAPLPDDELMKILTTFKNSLKS